MIGLGSRDGNGLAPTYRSRTAVRNRRSRVLSSASALSATTELSPASAGSTAPCPAGWRSREVDPMRSCQSSISRRSTSSQRRTIARPAARTSSRASLRSPSPHRRRAANCSSSIWRLSVSFPRLVEGFCGKRLLRRGKRCIPPPRKRVRQPRAETGNADERTRTSTGFAGGWRALTGHGGKCPVSRENAACRSAKRRASVTPCPDVWARIGYHVPPPVNGARRLTFRSSYAAVQSEPTSTISYRVRRSTTRSSSSTSWPSASA
jgi:hypothetical protein